MIAAEQGCKKISELLLEKGANPNIENRFQCLNIAADKDHKKIVALLIKNGTNLDQSNVNKSLQIAKKMSLIKLLHY